jgi:bifunctional UDP-N-acetylglucosamine pyrophosphorylase/glucosamine-1-phosphate N-acetyltransferase
MEQGVTMVDPATVYVDWGVELAPDVALLPGVMLQGRTRIGAGSEVGPDVRLVDTTVGARCRVHHAVVVSAEIGDECVVGPFAHLPPGTVMSPGTSNPPF